MSKQSIELGLKGEEDTASFLRASGYKIISTDYKTRFGQLDIIAKEKDVICFVEVKSRGSLKFGTPAEAVHSGKQKKIAQSALVYLKENKLLQSRARFDVACVEYIDNKPHIRLIKDAFPLNERYAY